MSDSLFATAIALPEGLESAAPTLALGGELKSSICLIRNGVAHLSEPIGDLEKEEVYRHFCASVDSVLANSEQKLEQIVIDKHPDYLSSKYGQKLAVKMKLPLIQVQHHYAHITAAMADNAYSLDSKPIIGVALDGLGFGEDGTIWGGEFLLADYQGFQRVGHFQPVAMPGGAAAIHEPWRNTLAHLLPIWDEIYSPYSDTGIVRFLNDKPLPLLQKMIDSGMNAPLAHPVVASLMLSLLPWVCIVKKSHSRRRLQLHLSRLQQPVLSLKPTITTIKSAKITAAYIWVGSRCGWSFWQIFKTAPIPAPLPPVFIAP